MEKTMWGWREGDFMGDTNELDLDKYQNKREELIQRDHYGVQGEKIM